MRPAGCLAFGAERNVGNGPGRREVNDELVAFVPGGLTLRFTPPLAAAAGGPRRVQHGNASAAVVLFVGAQFSGYRARSVPGQAARPRRWRSADVLVPRSATALGRLGRGRA